ncbi:Hpt domain-containing protein, partial [Tepidimonas sp.]|uniref:ATP-binding response regulator n=1 Tax=Tepidimonas sp. TaxID=2002775 RepID=UPI00391B4E31
PLHPASTRPRARRCPARHRTAAGPPADEARRLAEVEAALQGGEPKEARPAPPPEPASIRIGPLLLDSELYHVFLQEADAHSLALEQALDEWADGGDGAGGAGGAADVRAAAERAHALAGQAATIGHAPLAALARALEEALLRVATRPAPPANDRAVVARASRELRGLLHQLAAGCYREPAAETLAALAEWPPVPMASVAPVAPVIEAPPSPSSLEPVPGPTAAASAAPAVLDDFRAEAADLLPRLSAALARWADRGDGDAQAELLRLLHTAKGGARLAGLVALAEQAHALEAQVLAVPAAGPVPPALRRALDAWMVEAEQAGRSDAAGSPPVAPAPCSPLSPISPPPAPGEPDPVLRVRADLIERLLAGVTDQLANRQRLGGELGALRRSLRDMAANVERLRQQWRELQRQTESQTPARVSGPVPDGFDALELDRYTRVQELTRLLAESIDDVATVQHQMQRAVAAAEGHLAAQERQARDGQRALLEARLVPFDSVAERLARSLRQAAEARGRTVEWRLEGGAAVLDRAVLERLVPVLEHLLRNAVVHGIESPEARVAAGKPPAGRIALGLQVQGQDLSLTLTDDGAGLDLEGLRRRAVAAGLHPADAPFARDDAVRCALAPGISTAAQVDEWAGRGIGLDAVRSELLALGGRIEGFEPAGGGTGWHLVVPLTTAITAVVLVRVDDRVIGLPVPWVEAVRRVRGPELTAAELAGQWREGAALMPLFWLGALLLCDIEMPRMDGFELVRALRNDPRWTDLPVVMVTSRLADKHRAHAESLGVNHYLGKPYAEDELLALVAAYARLAPPGGRGFSPF